MKLTPIACAVVLLGATVLRAAPDAVPNDPFADPAAAKVDHDSSLGAGFANFCRENPSAPAPVGEKPLWFEYFIAELEHGPSPVLLNVPVAKLMKKGKGEWGTFEVRSNSSAGGGSVYTLERAPDGRLLAADERREVGTNVYVHLSPTDEPATLRLYRTRLEGWSRPQSGAVSQPIYSSGEIDTKVTLGTAWIVFGGFARQVTEATSGTNQAKTTGLSTVIYARLVDEKPKAAPQTIDLSGTIQNPTIVTR